LRAVPWADCFLVDGGEVVSLGTTPITTTLPVGAHRVRFKNDDRDEIVTVVIDAGKPTLVEKNW
jgi:Xaa-Pro aminopeptidase